MRTEFPRVRGHGEAMKERTLDSRRFIETLADDLTPVRPIARLRRIGAGVAFLWIVVAAGAFALLGLRADLLSALAESPAVGVIFVGLVLVAVGGVGAGLAASVPGREVAARGSLATGLVGVSLSAVVGGVLVIRGGAPLVPAAPISADVSCLGVALLLALPPALGALLFMARAAAYRPVLVCLFAATGSVALGALVVHLSCDCIHPRHLIVSHALAPVAGALLLTLPYRAALACAARRVPDS
jgi:hypothetical protein